MHDSSDERSKSQKLKKLNIIKKLKDYKDHEKISSILKEYEKKQESDYFLTQNNIKIGKILPYNHKIKEKLRFSFVGPSQLYQSQNHKKKITTRQNSLMQYKYSKSISSSRIERLKNINNLNITKNHVIDNKALRNFYNDTRIRIQDEKSKIEDRNKLLIEVPFGIRKSLINQENIFRKIMKEKKLKKNMQEKIIKKCNKGTVNDLLINKSINFDKKNEEISIIDKNITNNFRYKGNLWNITLRNIPINGKYENIGYLNVGDKYHPMYTIFEINKTIEYFNNPRNGRTKTEENKKRLKKIYSTLNENNYNLKLKHNLQALNNIQNLEINGKNLLDVEDKRESEIKGKKIMYNKHDLEYLIHKQKNKHNNEKEINEREIKSTLDDIYEEKTFAKNYKINDFFKNENITSRYTNKFVI